MADQAASNIPTTDESTAASATIPADKGKGKSAAPEESEVSLMEEDDVSEESEHEEAVSCSTVLRSASRVH
jgi:hypothetical protein